MCSSDLGIAKEEGSKTGDDWYLATRSETGGDADHVAFGDANIKEAVREDLSEPFGPGGVGHITVDDDDAWLGMSEITQCDAERIARGCTRADDERCG